MIDALSARLEERLDSDIVAWFTTVDEAGRPVSSVIWFLRTGDEIVIYSRPNKPKVRNVEANPNVGFNLNSDAVGNEMLSMEAVASIDLSYPPADRNSEFVAKYERSIAKLGMTPASFAKAYSVPIRLKARRARSW